MTRRVPFRIVLSCVVLLLGGRGVAADDPSLDGIAQAVQEWRSSWVTLRLETT
jgi:hypothetical protein